MMNQYLSSAHRVIPGGAHTNSKGDDQFPANAPRFLDSGKGCYVFDEDGNKFLDWTMGLRSISLGYAIDEINEAAIKQIYKGTNFGRPSPIEKEAAEVLLSFLPKAEMVKFAKNGSTVTTAAVKLARAFTGRDYVAFCQDHPFFSYDDWFIGKTACNSGVPKQISDLSLTFKYNDIESLQSLFDQYPGKIACVILEPATIGHPQNNFLHKVRDLCHKNGAIFILDEMITGFRWHLNGAQTYYGIEPDLATFGKGIANGFSLAALVGKREIMELGGLKHDKRRVFLISTTHGAENHSLAAGIAVMNFFKKNDVVSHMWSIGEKIILGMNEIAKSLEIEDYFTVGGVACSPYFVCKDLSQNISFSFRTLFLQEMIKQGIIINYIAPSFSHTADDVNKTLDAAHNALGVYKKALESGLENYLVGPSIKPVFREYN